MRTPRGQGQGVGAQGHLRVIASSSPSLPPSPVVNPFASTNLKKRKKEKEVAEEGELVPQKEGVPFK